MCKNSSFAFNLANYIKFSVEMCRFTLDLNPSVSLTVYNTFVGKQKLNGLYVILTAILENAIIYL